MTQETERNLSSCTLARNITGETGMVGHTLQTRRVQASCPAVTDVFLILLTGGREETSTFLKARCLYFT